MLDLFLFALHSNFSGPPQGSQLGPAFAKAGTDTSYICSLMAHFRRLFASSTLLNYAQSVSNREHNEQRIAEHKRMSNKTVAPLNTAVCSPAHQCLCSLLNEAPLSTDTFSRPGDTTSAINNKYTSSRI